jgi:hypothetical protein
MYHVKANDSHMWVEVFFPDYGWVEFEPTAGQPPIERFDPQMSAAPTPRPTLPPPTSTPQPSSSQAEATPMPEPTETPVGASPPAEPPSSANSSGSAHDQLRNSWTPYVLLIPLLLLIAWGAFNVLERAGFGKLPAIERAYAMLTRYASWLGVGKSHQHTPYEQAEALAQRAPQAQEPMQRITDLYVQKRFSAPKDGLDAAAGEANSAWRQARGWLRRALIRRR